MEDAERRQFYRTPCDAFVEYRIIENNSLDQCRAEDFFTPSDEFSMLSEFQQIDRQCAQLLRSIKSAEKALIDYLDLTQHKLNRLAQVLMSQHPTLRTASPQSICLSESGLSFESERILYKDSVLALRLVFLPHYQSVVLLAKVLRCEAVREQTPQKALNVTSKDASKCDNFHTAIEFLSLAETERQLIAQQVMTTQLVAQREAKKTTGNDEK